MQGVQNKLLVIMPQYMSTERKQLKYLMMDMVVVIDNTHIPKVVLDFKTLTNGALKSLVKKLGNTMAKLTQQI